MIGLTGASGYLASYFNFDNPIIINQNNINDINLDNINKIYHFGGLSFSGKPEMDYYQNIEYTYKILNKINSHCKIIFTSTVKIHNSENQDISDGYSLSKYLCEKIIYMKFLQDKNPYNIFRMPNIVSNNLKYGFLKDITDQIKTGHVKYVRGAFRPFLHISDCLQAFNYILPNGIFSLGNNSILIEDILDIASQYANFTTEELNIKPICILAKNDLTQYGWSPKNSYDVLDEYFAQAL